MNKQTGNKLNRLEHSLPEGLLADAGWFERHGYSRGLRSQYVSSGWLQQPTRGVFRRPRGQVCWEQAVISLQTLMDQPVTVGGRTALELQGYAHYLRQAQKIIHLYCDGKLPSWLHKLPVAERFIAHNRGRLWPHSDEIEMSLSLDQEAEVGRVLDDDFRITSWGQ